MFRRSDAFEPRIQHQQQLLVRHICPAQQAERLGAAIALEHAEFAAEIAAAQAFELGDQRADLLIDGRRVRLRRRLRKHEGGALVLGQFPLRFDLGHAGQRVVQPSAYGCRDA